jgi:hypothetical protein
MKRIKVRSQTGLDPSFLRRLSLNPTGPLSLESPRHASDDEFKCKVGMAAFTSAQESASADPTDIVAAGTRTGNAVVVLPSPSPREG